MDHPLFAPGFKTEPYWWDAAPRPSPDAAPLPAKVDVAVVGSGQTGLTAALTLARGGRSVAVLEAGPLGHGASTRNAGYVGRTLYAKFPKLLAKYGQAKAVALSSEALAANDYTAGLIESEQIACGYVACGRFIAAPSAKAYDRMARDLEVTLRHVKGLQGHMVPKAEQRAEAGTDHYHGGQVLQGTGALHPGLYQQGLMDRARSAGAILMGHCPVEAIDRNGQGFAVRTPKGTLAARDVVVATNGYTGKPTPLLRRRLIPVPAFQIATEPLAPDLLARLFPTRRTLIDTKINIYWARLSPDGTRIIFGARTGIDDGPLENKARRLHACMTEVFPELATTRLSHVWTGNMGFTFDLLPHVGVIEGVHYAAGFCGVGIPMGTYLGHKAALRVLGRPGAATAFDDLPFPTRPLYDGRPWFLPAVLGWYGLKDRLAG